MKLNQIILLSFVSIHYIFSQEVKPIGGGEYLLEHTTNCITEEQRMEIKVRLKENSDKLKREGIINSNKRNNIIVSFGWPLQKGTGFSFNSYYLLSNYLDHNSGSGLLDYNCGNRTYNGHKGIDIATWPFPWYIYDNDYVEVIAAESGVIIGKDDGNEDDHCSWYGNWNAVYIEHADGSVAWYGHLKNNSLTSKTVGQSVAKGEYLGILASSGWSTGPHLHFEVYDNNDDLIDPYAGNCNSLNGSSWWANQPAYREPKINTLLTHNAEPIHGCPLNNEIPHMSNTFIPGQTIYTAAYYQDQLSGHVTNYRIKRPNNTIWYSWNATATNTYSASWWYWTWTLPTNGPFGTWTFEATYQGQTYQHQFQYLSSLPVDLSTFEAALNPENKVIISWSTLSEQNNSGFYLDVSNNGYTWKNLTFVEGAWNSQKPNRYNFIHHKPYNGNNYYRLNQLDFDGSIETSKIISVAILPNEMIKIFPNPVSNILKIEGGYINNITVYNCFGIEILKSQNTSILDLTELPNGIYYITIETDTDRIIKRIFKNL